jgi:hypothetical protein
LSPLSHFRIIGSAFVHWLRSCRTVRLFKEDRLLLAGTLLLGCFALSPLLATPILPLVDMGSNVGAASLLNDAAFGDGTIAEHYRVNFRLVPYWTVYVLMACLEALGGALFAAKLIVGGAVLLLPIAGMRLLSAFGRSPRLGLWLFLLSWDTNLYWGWITFQYGMVLALLALAWIAELETLRDALKALPLTVLIALTHVHAIALVLTAGGLLALMKRPLATGVARTAVALLGCALPVLPWLWSRFAAPRGAGGSLAFDWHGLGHKVLHLFHYSLDNLPGEPGLSLAMGAFLVLTLGALALMALASRDTTRAQAYAPLLILAGAAGLYLALPFALWGNVSHWWTYPRFATYVLVAWLLVPRPDLSGRRALALLPGVVLAPALHVAVYRQFAEYGRYVEPYLEIIARLPHGSRFDPVDLDDYRMGGFRQPVLGQLHGYAAAVSSSYDPHLWDEANNPLRFRRNRMLPTQDWGRQTSFDLEAHGSHYDYLIVHPLDQDVIATNRRWRKKVELVHEAGQWRLYRVKDAARAKPPTGQADARLMNRGP